MSPSARRPIRVAGASGGFSDRVHAISRLAANEDVDVIVIRGGAAGEPGEVEQRIHRLKQKILGKATSGGSGAMCTGGRAHQD